MSFTRVSALAVVGLLSLQSAFADDELPAPIKALEAKGAVIKGSFDAPGGLKGYAAEVQQQGMALYLTPDGKHVLAGNLFDAKGSDLSEAPLQKLVYQPMYQQMWAQMEGSNWIADGAKDAPRVIYLFSDANCPYCNMFWEQARPWVKAGKVQLRHIMVGVIREDSAGKAATLLADANPEKALEKHEQAGRSSTLKAMDKIPQDIQAKLDANMKLMEDMGLSSTPSIFYKDANGHLQQQQGAPRADILAKMMGPK
ncbi:thiol:disulfide interchange protein DsbG [Pseudomonas sp. NPDC090202]|uniref:thiol:disulfide interchange protein DsbG n=1 Tax=unclassified Pseudomonas TaxID=196821 RepID=UPI0038255922